MLKIDVKSGTGDIEVKGKVVDIIADLVFVVDDILSASCKDKEQVDKDNIYDTFVEALMKVKDYQSC